MVGCRGGGCGRGERKERVGGAGWAGGWGVGGCGRFDEADARQS